MYISHINLWSGIYPDISLTTGIYPDISLTTKPLMLRQFKVLVFLDTAGETTALYIATTNSISIMGFSFGVLSLFKGSTEPYY